MEEQRTILGMWKEILTIDFSICSACFEHCGTTLFLRTINNVITVWIYTAIYCEHRDREIMMSLSISSSERTRERWSRQGWRERGGTGEAAPPILENFWFFTAELKTNQRFTIFMRSLIRFRGSPPPPQSWKSDDSPHPKKIGASRQPWIQGSPLTDTNNMMQAKRHSVLTPSTATFEMQRLALFPFFVRVISRPRGLASLSLVETWW